jgi:hypothetical protein
MINHVDRVDRVLEDGFAIRDDVLGDADLAALTAAVDRIDPADGTSVKVNMGGIRNLFELSPAIRTLAQSDSMRALLTPILSSRHFAVRAILFDKTPDANWKVPWHQDLTIAVRERREVEGFGPWTVKAGVIHVQPPASVLETMLSVRIHLDTCHAENGALRVLAGSHRAGRLNADQIQDWRGRCMAETCVVAAGGVLLMRPLLLHASSAATSPMRRRVIHIDYAADSLPGGLQWRWTYGRLDGR